MALTSFSFFPGSSLKAQKASSVEELLLRDDIQQAELQVSTGPRTARVVALQGEIEYRKGNFDQAAVLYRQALQMDPKSARAHFGLGKLSMAKLKASEAVESITKAIDLEPKEPLYRLFASEAAALQKNYTEQLKQLQEYVRMNPADPDRLAEAKAGIEVLQALGTKDIGVVTAPENPAPIRFKKSLNLIFTDVMVNGRGPYDFAIDTGASQVVLSEKMATELGLKALTSTVMHGVGGGGKIDTKLYSVDEIAVGDVKIKNLPIGTFNDPLVTQLADGILGTALLSDFILTVDYPGNQLQLAREKNPNVGGEVIPAWFFSNLLLVPMEINGTHRGNFVIDTGAVTTVLSHNMAAKLGVTEKTPGAKVDLGLSGVGGFEGVVLRVPNITVKSAKHSESYSQVVSINLNEVSKMIGTEVAGVIGFDFLEEYKVTLDYYGAEVRLEKQ
jgi:hypothetical protein